MSDTIFQLAYLSKRHEHLTDEEIVDGIVLPAITKNRQLSITGCLWFDHAHFFQVLEGTQDAIEPLFETIANDTRHASVTRILTENTGTRRFERFGMRAIESDAARSMPELVRAYAVRSQTSPNRGSPWWNPLAHDPHDPDQPEAEQIQPPPMLPRRVIDELAGWSDATPV